MVELSDRARGYILGNDILMASAFTMVCARFYCKINMGSRRGLWWDDLFVLLSLLFAVGFGATVNVSMAHYGWDRHIWMVDASVLSKSVKAYIVVKILFICSSTSVRMALLVFYLWLIKDLRDKPLSRIIYACMGFNIVVGLVGCFLSLFECLPVRAAWTYPTPIGASCMNEGISTTAIGAFLSLADLVVNILPVPIVARLQVPIKQRVAATTLLSLGTIATIAGVVREVFVYRALVATADKTWEALPLWICADVEIYVGLLCACVPSLRPLWVQIQAMCVRIRNTTTLKRIFPTSEPDTGDLHVPPTTTWEHFDKDVIFDGLSSFHSSTNLFGRKKKCYTTTVASRLNQVDSFFSRNHDTKDYAEMQNIEASTPVEPREAQTKAASDRLQTV